MLDNHDDDIEDNLSEDGNDGKIFEWDIEDITTLINNISQCLSKTDNSKYQTTIEKLDWDKIKFKNHSAESCKEQWTNIMSRLRKFRTMTDLVNDARLWVKQPWNSFKSKQKMKHPDQPKKPLTPYFRYFLKKRPKLKKKHPEMSDTDMAKLVSSQFAELSERKKAKYKAAYEKELVEYRKKMIKFKEEHPEFVISAALSKDFTNDQGPVKPKTPFQLFLQEKSKKQDEYYTKKENLDSLRKKWNDISEGKRMKWIKRALADEQRYQKELQDYLRVNPDYEPPQIKLLTKMEKDLKERCEGKPEKPPTSGYSLYSKLMLKEISDCPPKEKMSIIAKRWKELPSEEKESYNKEVRKALTKYIEKFESYINCLPEEEKSKALSESRVKLPSARKFKKILEEEKESKDLEQGVTAEELANDPAMNAAAQCFYQAEKLVSWQAKYPYKSTQEIINMIINEWNYNLPMKKKLKYFKMINKNNLSESSKPKATNDAILQEIIKKEPKKPPKSGYNVFLSEQIVYLKHLEPRQRLQEISRRWKNELSKEDQDEYGRRCQKLRDDYKKNFDKFFEVRLEDILDDITFDFNLSSRNCRLLRKLSLKKANQRRKK